RRFMNDPASVSIDGGDSARDAPQQLRAAVRLACVHDLPNKITALRGYLEIFERSEVDRLSNDGFQCLHRLRHAADEAAKIVEFLRDSLRLSADAPKLGRVDLRELVEELRIASRTFLDGAPAWSAELAIPAVTCDEGLLLRGLTEVLKGSPVRPNSRPFAGAV